MIQELQKIFDKMGEMVGVKNVDPKEERWFMKHSWTIKQQNEFEKWLTEYLSNRKIWKTLYSSYYNKKKVKKAARWFIFNYGWKSREDDL